MDQERLELPVSPTAQDLFALEHELRDETSDGREPDVTILSSLPPAIRDRILLQLEFMELQAGQIRTIFSAMHPDPEQRRKAKEKNRRAWDYLLQEIAAYTRTFSEAAFVVAAAKIAVNDAIIMLDRNIARLQKFKRDPGAYAQIKDFKLRKSRLEQFRNVTLDRHEKTLKTDPAPRETKLHAIKEDIEETLKDESLAHKIFAKLMHMAPAALEKFRLRNTTKSLFKDVAKEVSPLRPLPLKTDQEPDLPAPKTPSPATPTISRRPMAARMFSGMVKGVGRTIVHAYERVSANHLEADAAFNRRARGKAAAGMVAAASVIPAIQNNTYAQNQDFLQQRDPVRIVETAAPSPRLPAPDDPGFFTPPEDLSPDGLSPTNTDSGDDDGDGGQGGDHDDHGPHHPV